MKTETINLLDFERQPCEIWTRVMGYHRSVSQFNIGKKSEFAERKCFSEMTKGFENNVYYNKCSTVSKAA
jgi:hypothetical protein